MPRVACRSGCGRLPFALAGLVLAACAEPTSLEGSLGEVIDLGFEAVEVAQTEDAVIVGYHRRNGEARDIVFKLVLEVLPQNVVPGVEMDLGPGPDGEPRASATRAVGEDPIRTYAAIRRGFLRLDQRPQLDQPVSGEFRVTLGEGGDAGEGRTAFGNFSVERVVPGN